MLSNIFNRLLTSVRPIHNYQQHFRRLLSTIESPDVTPNLSNTRETGIVKRFSKEKGYGFISKNSDGTDCFIHFKNINTTGFKTLEQGQEVEFTVVQGEKGIEARDVSIINTGTSRMPFIAGSSNNNPTSSRFGFDRTSRNQSSSSFFDFGGTKSSELHSEQQSKEKIFNFNTGLTSSTKDSFFSSRRTGLDNNQTREMGSVKRWTGDRGFGFIRRANGGPDLFCHVRSLKDGIRTLTEGQTVEYTIHTTNKGEEARDVTILNEEGIEAHEEEEEQQQQQQTPSTGQRQTGTVKRWMPEKGYGFLQRDSGASDIFVHVRELSNGVMSLEEGQQVEFDLVKNDKGDMAHNVTIRSET